MDEYLLGWLASERIAELRAQAARERLAALAPRPPRRAWTTIGRRFVAAGRRLVAAAALAAAGQRPAVAVMGARVPADGRGEPQGRRPPDRAAPWRRRGRHAHGRDRVRPAPERMPPGPD